MPVYSSIFLPNVTVVAVRVLQKLFYLLEIVAMTSVANSLESFTDANNRWYVLNVAKSEIDCVRYLQYFGIFTAAPIRLGRNGHSCNTNIAMTSHRGSLARRCTSSRCQMFKTFYFCNDYFLRMSSCGNRRRKLRIHDISEIAWNWCYSRITLDVAAVSVGVSKQTIHSWYAHCFWICTATESMLPKMKGTADQPIQVDESNLARNRNYHRGKLRFGDVIPPE